MQGHCSALAYDLPLSDFADVILQDTDRKICETSSYCVKGLSDTLSFSVTR